MDMTPPTDNLYKFVCVLGIVVVGASAGLLIHAVQTIDRHADSFLEGASEYLSLSGKYIHETNKWKEYARDAGALDIDETAKLKQMLDATDPLEDRLHELEAPFTAQLGMYEKRVGDFELTRMISILGMLAGAALSLIGGFLWYRRLQVGLDAKPSGV